MKASKYEQIKHFEDTSPELARNELIVQKSNALIEISHSLDIHEQQIILTLASLINSNNEKFYEHTIKAKDMATLLQVDDKNYFARLKNCYRFTKKKSCN